MSKIQILTTLNVRHEHRLSFTHQVSHLPSHEVNKGDHLPLLDKGHSRVLLLDIL